MTCLRAQSCGAFYGRLTANLRSESGNYCRSTVLLSDAQAQSATGEPSGEDRVFVMAVRHEVENLIRRGSIFYWRPRIPAAFIHCRPGSGLSLSLHCSDHKEAQILGRKLNTHLAELKIDSKEAMASKQQPQILFEHVRDEEADRLDDISTTARRNGRGGDVVAHVFL